MKNSSYEDDFLDDLEDIPEEYTESMSSKRKYRKNENIQDLVYSEDEVKNVWIYPLYTLNGGKITNGIRISNEKITIMATMSDMGQKASIYIESEIDYDLLESVDPANPTEQIIKNSERITFSTDEFTDIDFDYLYLLTFEKITEDNFSGLKKYLSKSIVESFDGKKMEMSFSNINEFSSGFKAVPIRIVLSPPIQDKIKEISVTSPPGALVGNIKVVDNKGRFPELIAKEGTEIFPKLMFPFQTEPVLNLVDYWSSDQIISLKDIFDFFDKKGKKYNEEISLQDFLVLGDFTDPSPIKVDHASKIEYRETGNYDTGSFAPNGIWIPGKPEPYSMTVAFEVGGRRLKGHQVGFGDGREIYYNIEKIDDVNITPTNIEKSTSAFDTLKKMLTESFWKDYEFKGATISKKLDDQWVVQINDEKIYELSEKYQGQDRYAVTTNIWLSWKKINNKSVIENKNIVKRIESTMAMLSGSIKSNFSINKGDNDDYKVLLPYYFEIQNQIDNPTGYVEYSDIIVKLKSNYFDFTENSITPIDPKISNNKIHKLEYNHYAFPEMTKMTETASIPSSMPIDQQTANGEYSKYQVKTFSNLAEDIKIIKSQYGSGNINFNALSNQYVTNNGNFKFDSPAFINEIKLSSFFGSGLWRIILTDQNNIDYKIDLELFDKNDSTFSFVNLIL